MKILANDGLNQSGVDALQQNGFEVITNKVPQENLISYINENQVAVLLVRSATQVTKEVIDSCPSIKIIGRGGVGMDNIEVEYDTNCTLSAESAIYCGLIINELLTNSFKHAFAKNELGFIKIDFFKNDNEYSLIYSDNGKGYDSTIKKESLGLILIETLIRKQLKAKLDINSTNGVKVKIKWKE